MDFGVSSGKRERQQYYTMSFIERCFDRVAQEGKSLTGRQPPETNGTGPPTRRRHGNCQKGGESERGLMCLGNGIQQQGGSLSVREL